MSTCQIAGCPNEVYVVSTENGAECRQHMAERMVAENTEVIITRCANFARVPHEWMTRFGTETGKSEWMESQRHYYKTERSLKAAYTRLLKRAVWEESVVSFTCVKGFECQAVQRVLGMSVGARGAAEHLSDTFCDRQDSCKEYRPVVSSMRSVGDA